MSLLENKTVLIIGLGLIGGSIARGLSGVVPGIRILAYGRDEAALQAALIDGSIHAYATMLDTVASQADVIMLCTPTLTVRTMLEQLKDLVTPDAIITDAASVKGNIVSDAHRFFSDSLHRFVPGHPIAGSEQSGYKASKPDLFKNRKVILTPLPENSVLAVRTVMQLWQALGADVHGMTARRHDEVLAATSHLPHLLAYTLVNTLVDSVSESDRARQVFDYAAGGFADFSRIASSDPHMWRDIFLANRDATVNVLDAYIDSLGDMRQRLLLADGDGLQSEFARAKRVRDEFMRRFRPSPAEHPDVLTSGFNIESSYLLLRPGVSMTGSYRPPGSLQSALTVLEQSAVADGVSVIEGFPESVAALSAIHAVRAAGCPVVGPEQGTVRVYGAGSGTSNHSMLTADPVITGVFIMAAKLMPGSSIQLDGVKNDTKPGSLLVCLQTFGARITITESKGAVIDLLCESSELSGARFDMRDTQLTDDELRIVILAAALAAGESRFVLANERINSALGSIEPLLSLVADIQTEDGMLSVYPHELQSVEVNLEGNVTASLLAIVTAQKVRGRLLVHQPGDLAEHYPGLLQALIDMGIDIEFS